MPLLSIPRLDVALPQHYNKQRDCCALATYGAIADSLYSSE